MTIGAFFYFGIFRVKSQKRLLKGPCKAYDLDFLAKNAQLPFVKSKKKGRISLITDYFYLQGDGCCGSDETCQMAADALMPYAMPALAGVLVERASSLCCDNYPPKSAAN